MDMIESKLDTLLEEIGTLRQENNEMKLKE